MTYLTVNHEYSGGNDQEVQRKTYSPATPIGPCPVFNCEDKPDGTIVQRFYWNVFFVEFFATFCFTFTWLIIRNFNVEGPLEKWQALVKPFLIGLAYSTILLFDASLARGLMNPTLIIQIWFWGMGSYNNKQNLSSGSQTVYNFNHYGRYIWVYILADYVAAIAAGYLGRLHFDNLNENGLKDDKVEPFVEN